MIGGHSPLNPPLGIMSSWPQCKNRRRSGVWLWLAYLCVQLTTPNAASADASSESVTIITGSLSSIASSSSFLEQMSTMWFSKWWHTDHSFLHHAAVLHKNCAVSSKRTGKVGHQWVAFNVPPNTEVKLMWFTPVFSKTFFFQTAYCSVRWVVFHKVVRQHYSGEVDMFVIFWCEIFSVFSVHQKLLKSVHFSPSDSNYKKGAFLRDSVYAFYMGKGGLLKKNLILWGECCRPHCAPFECATV